MAQQLFEGLLDPACNADLPGGGKLKKRFEKLDLLFFAQVASAPYAVLAALDRSRTKSVVPGYHVIHCGNRNACMDSDFPGWARVSQRVPDHKAPTLLSSGGLPHPYGHLEFREMRQCRRDSTPQIPPKIYVGELTANSILNRISMNTLGAYTRLHFLKREFFLQEILDAPSEIYRRAPLLGTTRSFQDSSRNSPTYHYIFAAFW
ncbi:MAG: hypothetical protein FJY85_12880 [Deltaproteobacteria bacterium]|nr:hypothetical protein [Deltaproteobacteria bacterium]